MSDSELTALLIVGVVLTGTLVTVEMGSGSEVGGLKRKAPEAVSLANSSAVSTSFFAAAVIGQKSAT